MTGTTTALDRLMFHLYKPFKNIEIAAIVKRAAHARRPVVKDEHQLEWPLLGDKLRDPHNKPTEIRIFLVANEER